MAGGAPRQYKTVEELEEVIEEYFETDAYMGEGDNRVFAPTVSGLAYALNLSRQGLLNYEERPEFVDTIKRAKARIARTLEQRLYGNNVTGIIFNLKNNYGWNDKQQIEHSGKLGIEDLSDDELEQIAKGSD